jgi:hypothetical protein
MRARERGREGGREGGMQGGLEGEEEKKRSKSQLSQATRLEQWPGGKTASPGAQRDCRNGVRPMDRVIRS